MSSIQCYEPKEKSETLTPMSNNLVVDLKDDLITLKDEFGFNVQVKKEDLLQALN